MPGSEIGSDNPMCIFEEHGNKTDLHLEEAAELAKGLTLKPTLTRCTKKSLLKKGGCCTRRAASPPLTSSPGWLPGIPRC